MAPNFKDAARPLVHHVLGVGLRPRALAQLHDHPIFRLVPIAPDVLVSPATAHTVISSSSSGSGRVFALRPARSIGLSISALWRAVKLPKKSAPAGSPFGGFLCGAPLPPFPPVFFLFSPSPPPGGRA